MRTRARGIIFGGVFLAVAITGVGWYVATRDEFVPTASSPSPNAVIVAAEEASDIRSRQEAAERLRLALEADLRRQAARTLSGLLPESGEDRSGQTEEARRCIEQLRTQGIVVTSGNACIDIDDVIENLRTGTYRFNNPKSAYVDEPFRVVLALATGPDQDVSREFERTQGLVAERQAPWGRYLEATLRGGPDFTVTPLEAQRRTATSSAPVIWEWTVVPLRPGTKALVIDVAATLVMGSQRETVQIQTLSEEIRIKVGLLRWVTSTLSGPLGIVLGLAVLVIGGLGTFYVVRSRTGPGYAEGNAARFSGVGLLGATREGSARAKLRKAILTGFNPASLDETLRDNEMLGPNIALGPDFKTRVNSLIDTAREEGWVIELCDVLAAARAGNEPVASAIRDVQKWLVDERNKASAQPTTEAAVIPSDRAHGLS